MDIIEQLNILSDEENKLETKCRVLLNKFMSKMYKEQSDVTKLAFYDEKEEEDFKVLSIQKLSKVKFYFVCSGLDSKQIKNYYPELFSITEALSIMNLCKLFKLV